MIPCWSDRGTGACSWHGHLSQGTVGAPAATTPHRGTRVCLPVRRGGQGLARGRWGPSGAPGAGREALRTADRAVNGRPCVIFINVNGRRSDVRPCPDAKGKANPLLPGHRPSLSDPRCLATAPPNTKALIRFSHRCLMTLSPKCFCSGFRSALSGAFIDATSRWHGTRYLAAPLRLVSELTVACSRHRRRARGHSDRPARPAAPPAPVAACASAPLLPPSRAHTSGSYLFIGSWTLRLFPLSGRGDNNATKACGRQ